MNSSSDGFDMKNRVPKEPGHFITFEGGEGSGKSTQIKLLADHLRKADFDVLETREPGGSPNAEAIRQYLLSGMAEGKGPRAEAMLFTAARMDHVENTIKPALNAGTWVLCDRFMDSTRVYQGMDLDTETVDLLEKIAVEKTRPDMTILLDLPAKQGLQRALSRDPDGIKDRFEKEDEALHEERRQAFLRLAQSEPKRIAIIDASKPEHIVDSQVWKACRRRFGIRTPMGV
ncbi:dTMP kinase [Pararhizobium sp. IMCC21322]|uniref:dTMP kinase n=1 Tax=Pararhizobium sp. IMCC21322 TaxID=3067903 RepID=UPI0027413899|nr:dTMP kinase [Pararhizobium sp. IMCC21322]